MNAGTQSAPLKRRVLIAANQDEPLVDELVNDLCMQGLDARKIETLQEASRADEAAACIVMLRPVTWRSASFITTAMRSNSPYLMPLLVEPMSLPAAAWATEPITVKEPLSVTAQELATVIDNHGRELRKRMGRSRAAASLSTGSFGPAPMRRRWLPRLTGQQVLQLILILIICVGIIVYFLPRIASTQVTLPTLTGPLATSMPDNFFQHPYTAMVPGKGCDASGADWQTGSYYKQPTSPTAVKSATASVQPQASPTLQDAVDSSVMATCQPNGLSLSHNSQFHDVAMMDLLSPDVSLPDHYRVQVTTKLVPWAGNSAAVYLSVKAQAGKYQNVRAADKGYGDEGLSVDSDGYWSALRINDETDQFEPALTHGYIAPSQTHVLAAEVDGPKITYFIDNRAVTTIVDTTYPASYGLGLGVNDYGKTVQPQALFSHFSYTPLVASQQPSKAVLATATAQTSQENHAAYSAALPGFGCDKGPGQWLPVPLSTDDAVTAKCLSNGLSLTSTSNHEAGYVIFFGRNNQVSADAKIKLQLTTATMGDGTAGIMTRTDKQTSGGYAFYVHANGAWEVGRYSSQGGTWQPLDSGVTAPSALYTMEVQTNGSALSLALNGTQVSSLHDTTYKTTDHITLSIVRNSGSSSAIFSNFVFTPLP